MNAWLVGHGGCYNRGCEAIVRSTASLLAERFKRCRYTIWSYDRATDIKALRGKLFRVRDAHKRRGRFDRCRAARKLGRLPGGKLAQRILRWLPGSPTCALSIGGDNFTLDYGVPGQVVKTGRLLMDAGVPFVIWGASIGPFGADQRVEEQMRQFLQQVDLITVRESRSVEYLRSLGITRNVVQVFDPAFVLKPEPYQGPEALFVASGNVVGLNISALIAQWFPENNLEAILDEVAAFVDTLIAQGFEVLLVPHVTAKNYPIERDDERVLEMLYGRIDHGHENIALLPGNVPAAQVKWVISRCRFFVGARTHSTIAAFSTGVPTIVIGYSQKARGICRDLFGNEDYCVPTSKLSTQTLMDVWERLRQDEAAIRHLLERKRPEMLSGARRNAEALAELLGNGHLQ